MLWSGPPMIRFRPTLEWRYGRYLEKESKINQLSKQAGVCMNSLFSSKALRRTFVYLFILLSGGKAELPLSGYSLIEFQLRWAIGEGSFYTQFVETVSDVALVLDLRLWQREKDYHPKWSSRCALSFSLSLHHSIFLSYSFYPSFSIHPLSLSIKASFCGDFVLGSHCDSSWSAG